MKQSAATFLTEAIAWRWKFLVLPRVRRLLGVREIQWGRVVMQRECEAFVRSLPWSRMRVADISALPDNSWSAFGFASYTSTSYPAFDICAGPLEEAGFDLVFLDQVLEHVERPLDALRNVHAMLKPGGWCVVTTPFLIKIHAHPDDYSRWTAKGLKQLLAQAGFLETDVSTNAWGNRACVKANFRDWARWIPWWHSLRNEPMFPVTVWAFARRAQRVNAKSLGERISGS